MAADGHIRGARGRGVEHSRVGGHRLLRAVRVHASSAPAEDVPQAPEAHCRVLRPVPRLHGRVRAVVRQFVARRLGRDGHGRGHRTARSRRLRGLGHMCSSFHEDAAQYCRTPHSHTHR